MTTKELTLTSIAFLAATGGVYVIGKGGVTEQVKIVADTGGAVALGKADADAVLFDDAGQPRAFADGTSVTCAPGGYLDGVYREDKEWCSDGAGVAWVRDARGAETITIVGGRAFSTKPVAAVTK